MREYRLPSGTEFASLLELGRKATLGLSDLIRPRAPSDGLPGGLLKISEGKPLIIVPDLHARPAFVETLRGAVFPGVGVPLSDALARGLAAILFLGDIPHAEGPDAARRWVRAFRKLAAESDERAILSPEMDEEMGLSIQALSEIISLQAEFHGSVFCLKGNHDNMTNASDHGDFPFYKYADEGRMGALWLRLRYEPEIAHLVREYELSLPIAARGATYCASHAEPAFPVSESMLLNYRHNSEVVRALIWTANDEAEEGAVGESLKLLLGSDERATHAMWFSGHRPVAGSYSLRAAGRLAQIHNPGMWQVVLLYPGEGVARFYKLVPETSRVEEIAVLVLDPLARQK